MSTVIRESYRQVIGRPLDVSSTIVAVEVNRRLGIHSKVRVKVAANSDRAVELLTALPTIKEVRSDGEMLLVTFQDGEEANGVIARTLVNGNLDIVSIQPEKLKLDDAFLQLTKGIVH